MTPEDISERQCSIVMTNGKPSSIEASSLNCSLMGPYFKSSLCTHQMNSKLGVSAVELVIDEIMKSQSENLYWRSERNQVERLSVSTLSIYSDKPQMSLKPSAFSFFSN